MMSGETGYKPFRLNGRDYYVFYKPFTRRAVPGRSVDKMGWSVGIIYPENDIFGDYNLLFFYVLIIAIVGLLVMFMLTRAIVKHQLKPLLMLSEKAQLIAKGNYDEPIPDSSHHDEIGRLQTNFKLMQQSLATHIHELEQLKNTLQEHGRVLGIAYNQAKKADRMKMAFLHNMTNQMLAPAEAIDKDVSALGDFGNNTEEVGHLAKDIHQQGNTIAELLKNLITMSDEEKGKEADHV